MTRPAPDAPIFIDTRDVAALLGWPADMFLRARPALQAQGFPPPIPGFRSPLRWYAQSVDDWIARARRGEPPAPPPAAAAPVAHNVHLLALARRGRG